MSNTCPEVIGSLAFGLHMKKLPDMETPIPEGESLESIENSELFSMNNGVVLYPSLEARNQCVAQYAFTVNQTAFRTEPAQWLHLAHKLWRCEITNGDKASGRLLSLVSQEHDVFSLASGVINSDEMRTFDVLHTVESSLPYLEQINLDGLVNLCIAQYEHTKNDLMSGRFFNELETVLIKRPNDCLALHGLISANPLEETQGLYQVALTSLVKSSEDQGLELLLKDSGCSNILLKSAASWALGLLLSCNQIKSSRSEEVEGAILKNISSEAEPVRNPSIRAATRCLLVTNSFDGALMNLAESDDQISLCSIAESLFFNFKEMESRPGFEKWLRLLSRINPEYAGGINNFDYVLSHLIEDSSEEKMAIEILSDWIVHYGRNGSRDKSVAELFGSTFNALIQKPELIATVLTDWYLASEGRLAAAATGLLAEMKLRKISEVAFDFTRLNILDGDDLVLLVRRMLGYVSDEDHLFSLTHSLLNTEDAKQRTYGLVNGLFINELGEDYPGSSIEFLTSAKEHESDPDRLELYSNAIQEISARIQELEGLPRLQEFHANGELERALFKARAKQMSVAMAEANKGSIVEMIATKVPIKGGKGWFSHRDGEYSESSFLQSFSTEISIPRRCVTDEVGQEIQGLMFRNAQKGDG